MQGFDATGAGPILAQSLEEFSRRGDRRNQMFNCGTGTDFHGRRYVTHTSLLRIAKRHRCSATPSTNNPFLL
jgi:hypothetical protein